MSLLTALLEYTTSPKPVLASSRLMHLMSSNTSMPLGSLPPSRLRPNPKRLHFLAILFQLVAYLGLNLVLSVNVSPTSDVAPPASHRSLRL
ncbi:transmembrane protein, putative [Rhizoctonia solani AG-3 Rhs1AP]|uniref:Transmembrane protein, putative n=1 Tax=Rhizoctonia solani AG-3 Rhs1AP TaxID=1086054 RepID=X8JST6_9AGAM|nr:transmembrane protein, putative [Rhizoctonia solani AG-3 Rhs1AP]